LATSPLGALNSGRAHCTTCARMNRMHMRGACNLLFNHAHTPVGPRQHLLERCLCSRVTGVRRECAQVKVQQDASMPDMGCVHSVSNCTVPLPEQAAACGEVCSNAAPAAAPVLNLHPLLLRLHVPHFVLASHWVSSSHSKPTHSAAQPMSYATMRARSFPSLTRLQDPPVAFVLSCCTTSTQPFSSQA
jgi:hypothetical protein